MIFSSLPFKVTFTVLSRVADGRTDSDTDPVNGHNVFVKMHNFLSDNTWKDFLSLITIYIHPALSDYKKQREDDKNEDFVFRNVVVFGYLLLGMASNFFDEEKRPAKQSLTTETMAWWNSQ